MTRTSQSRRSPDSVHLLRGEAQVGAVEARDHLVRATDAEAREDVTAHGRVGGRGERERARLAELRARHAECEVVGAEVVPPLGDTVRLVDHKEPHAVALQPGDEPAVRESFRRDVQQRRATLGEVDEAAILLARRERRVDVVSGDARGLQGLHLVLHERDQRRHDERAADLERGQHVAEALPPARGHDAQHVAVREQFEYLGLTEAKVRVAEALAQQLAVPIEATWQVGRQRGRGCGALRRGLGTLARSRGCAVGRRPLGLRGRLGRWRRVKVEERRGFVGERAAARAVGSAVGPVGVTSRALHGGMVAERTLVRLSVSAHARIGVLAEDLDLDI